MKAIIFDLDNTLVIWKEEFIFALKNVINNMNLNLSNDEIKKINNALDSYEYDSLSLSKQELLDYVNQKSGLELSIDFIDNIVKEQSKCFYKDDKLEKTLSYLSKKYDLFVLSNWFTYTQEKRLENMGILKYFKKVIGADENYMKPDKRSFDIFIKNYKYDSYISVGDSLKNDVLLPISLGIDAIWLTKEKKKGIKTISEIYDLEKVL